MKLFWVGGAILSWKNVTNYNFIHHYLFFDQILNSEFKFNPATAHSSFTLLQ